MQHSHTTTADERQGIFHAIVASVRDYAMFTIDLKGLISTWNAGAHQIFGYRTEEIVGRPVSLIFTEEDIRAGAPESERERAARDGRAIDKRWHLRKDGGRFWADGVVTPIHSGEGCVIGFVKIMRDATEVQRLEEERERLLLAERTAREEAEAAISARDAFLAIAAHELRTPLTAIVGYAQVLERRLSHIADLSERDRRALHAIVDQSDRAHQLIGSLLDMARLHSEHDRLSLGLIDLCDLTQQIAADVEPLLYAHTIAIDCDGPALVLGDPLRLEQVLQNLLQNAVKYSPDGGHISVRLSQDEGSVLWSVSDQGVGIPEGVGGRLFERFYRANHTTGVPITGMGIGLYVVHELVALHGGTVEVASSVGGGSTFVVRLPRAPGS
ncbi:MAG: hypothetical protein RLZZ387_3808 [Chloroflexota bacterium]|jgi:PAS domain S-box-containing protein